MNNESKHRLLIGAAALICATALWLPCVQLFFTAGASDYSQPEGMPPKARELADRHLDLWIDRASRDREVGRMRVSNAEWDFMGRAFLVWSLAEMAHREPASKLKFLRAMDAIIDDTLRLERENDIHYFLMPYSRIGSFMLSPPRSQFIDGEIALMLATRRMVAENPDYKTELTQRVDEMARRMQISPSISAESYPDECWTFCNTVALAAIKLADHLDGTDHTPLFQAWIDHAKANLIHEDTGMLVSSYTFDGTPLDGPEGSSIWLAAHCLRLIDEEFAEDQYRRARKELGRTVLGFSYSREWPNSWVGPTDIDSGGVIPILGASAGGSGLAFVGASSFGDQDYLAGLHAALDMAAFPSRRDGRLSYRASNQVGDAVLLYSTVLGPIWKRVLKKGNRS